MRVVVTGGRNYNEQARVWKVLDDLHARHAITLLVTGACYLGGADLHAENWAKYNEVPYFGLPAKFKTGKHGKREGMIRNGLMLDTIKPDRVVAFPGGTGTNGCVSEAHQRNIYVEDHRE